MRISLGVLLALLVAAAGAEAQTVTVFKLPTGVRLVGSDSSLFVDTSATSTYKAGLSLRDNGTEKWSFTKDASNNLFIYDAAASANLLLATPNGSLTLSRPAAASGGAPAAPFAWVSTGSLTGDAVNADRPLDGVQIAHGNAINLNRRYHKNSSAGNWNGVAMGLSCDVDATVSACGALWFYNDGTHGTNLGINNLTPTATLDITGSLRVSTAFPVVLGCSGSIAATATTYFFVAAAGSSASATTSSVVNQVTMPWAGKVVAVYWRYTNAPTTSTINFLLTKNGTNGGTMASSTGTSSSGNAAVSSNNTFAAGDQIACGVGSTFTGAAPGGAAITYLIQPQ